MTAASGLFSGDALAPQSCWGTLVSCGKTSSCRMAKKEALTMAGKNRLSGDAGHWKVM